jgi:hypothetical protein
MLAEKGLFIRFCRIADNSGVSSRSSWTRWNRLKSGTFSGVKFFLRHHVKRDFQEKLVMLDEPKFQEMGKQFGVAF